MVSLQRKLQALQKLNSVIDLYPRCQLRVTAVDNQPAGHERAVIRK